MAFRCMNCNGSMVFDVASQQMRCMHCDSTCDPQDFVVRDTSPEAGGRAYVTDEGLALFTCQNCAATLEATEDSMIGICPYCGGQSLLKSEAERHDMEHIIPFQVSKEQCVDLYGKYTKGIRYLPREFKDPTFIQNFTGIYMPFFQYDAEFGKTDLTGTKTVEHNPRYDVVNTYRIEGEVEGDYPRGVVFDGSKYLDDEISAQTLPFDPSCEVPFNPAYLAGFYADTSTVRAERYYGAAAKRASEDLKQKVSNEVRAETGIKLSSGSTIESTITGHHTTMHPMWFLTWRKEDRVAYAVVNGQSGKIVSDLPLDVRSFILGCVIVAAAIFAVLELLVQPTPLVTSIVSLAAAFFMAVGIKSGAQREFEQQTHANDLGWKDEEDIAQGDAEQQGAQNGKKPKEKKKLGCLAIAGISIGSIVLFSLVAVFFAANSDGTKAGNYISALKLMFTALAVGYTIFASIKISRWRKDITQTTPTVSISILMLTIMLNVAIIFISPVNDGWYYLGDAVCILGLIASAIGMIRMYNVSATRPLPKLFGREEV